MTDLEHDRPQFSVYQFFVDDSCERVASFVTALKAAEIVAQLIHSLDARVGTTRRVIITDGLDCLAWEWKHGHGITSHDAIATRH
jgi:hypothetical protein